MITEGDENNYYVIIQKVKDAIKNADYILIGGASGMSSAGGPDWYNDGDPTYLRNFQDIENKYHAGSLWKNYYLTEYTGQKWESREDWWGYMSTLMHFIKHEPVYEPYKDLRQILDGKDFDIVTTNQDHQFVKAFPEKDVAIIQGDWTYLQCSKRCHDEVYPVEDLIDQWYSNVQNGKLPSEFIPHCQKCGAELHEWVRGFDFLQGTFYKQQYDKYRKFVEKSKNRPTIFLELGVGMMTPEFIKEPFMNLTYNNMLSTYIPINPKQPTVPEEIANRTIEVKYDILKVLSDIKNSN